MKIRSITATPSSQRVAWYGVRLFTEGCTLDRSAMDPEGFVWWLSSRPAAAMPTGNSAGCSTSSEAAAAASPPA
jgi:hypothetical protein